MLQSWLREKMAKVEKVRLRIKDFFHFSNPKIPGITAVPYRSDHPLRYAGQWNHENQYTKAGGESLFLR